MSRQHPRRSRRKFGGDVSIAIIIVIIIVVVIIAIVVAAAVVMQRGVVAADAGRRHVDRAVRLLGG